VPCPTTLAVKVSPFAAVNVAVRARVSDSLLVAGLGWHRALRTGDRHGGGCRELGDALGDLVEQPVGQAE